MKKIALVCLLTLLYAAPVFSDTSGKNYIAADYGKAQFVPSTVYNDPGMIGIAGGHYFNSMFAVEVGYTQFDAVSTNVTGGSKTIVSYAFHVAGVVSYPVFDDFDLIANFGVTNNQTNAVTTGSPTNHVNKSSILYGVGSQYHVSPKVNVRLLYEDYGDFNDTSPSQNLTAFSIGIIYLY